jgi:uncharacterized membrane protein (UPF0127 family)
MGSSSDMPIYFRTRFGIHTFFVKYKLVLVILDDNFTVQLIKVVPPSRIIFWNPRYSHILEIPIQNKIHKKITIGTRLTLQVTNNTG